MTTSSNTRLHCNPQFLYSPHTLCFLPQSTDLPVLSSFPREWAQKKAWVLMRGQHLCFFLTEQVSPLIWPQTDHRRMTVAIIVGFDEVVTVRDYPWLNDGVSIWYPSISFSKEQGKSSHVYLVTSSARGQCTGEKTEGHMWWKHTGTCQSKWNWSPRRPDNLDRMIKAPWLTHKGLGRVGGTWINKKGSRLMGEHLEKVTFVRNRG